MNRRLAMIPILLGPIVCALAASLASGGQGLSDPWSDAPPVIEGAQIDKKGTLETTWYGSKYYLAPITVPIDVYQKIKADRPVNEILAEDGRYVVGYAAIVAAGTAAHRYYSISAYDFNELVDRGGNTNPEKILFLSKKSAVFGGLYKVLLRRRYPNATITEISGETSRDILAKVAALPQDEQFDRIDWSVHGSPGKVEDGRITTIDSAALKKLSAVNVLRSGGELRLISCGVARSGLCGGRAGEEFASELGRIFVPNGGSVFVSTKSVNAIIYDPSMQPKITKVIDSFIDGPFQIISASKFLMDPFALLPIDPSRTHDVLEVKRSPPISCNTEFTEIKKWHRR